MKRLRTAMVIMTLATTIVMSPAIGVGAQAPTANPSFEAASVKPNNSGDRGPTIMVLPGGRVTLTNVTLRGMIALAYGPGVLALLESQIIGGPTWIGTDRFDVVAKADGNVQQPTPDAPTPVAMMLRELLKDRFKLVAHTETREGSIYALVIARSDGKLGPQLRPSPTDCDALRARGALPRPNAGERLLCGVRAGRGMLSAGSVNMATFVGMLSRLVDRRIVDRTGLSGNYELDLTWTPDQLPQPPPGGPPPGAPPLPPIDPNGPPLVTAIQEQLGLKLDSQRGPVDVVIVDSADHPTQD